MKSYFIDTIIGNIILIIIFGGISSYSIIKEIKRIKNLKNRGEYDVFDYNVIALSTITVVLAILFIWKLFGGL